MSLHSDLLKNDPRLQACLTSNASHLVEGAAGSHVAKVQVALFIVDGLGIQREEIKAQRYGPSTAKAVLAFKTKRRIINRSYQTAPDNIVGKMTIAALDQELLRKQPPPVCYHPSYCGNDPRNRGPAREEAATGSPSALVTLPSAGGSPDLISTPSPGPLRRLVPSQSHAARGSAGLISTPSAGGASPATVAKTRASGGITAVRKAHVVITQLLNFHQHPPAPPHPPLILREFDAVWRNFGMPKVPLNDPTEASQTNGKVRNLEDFLEVIQKVLKEMENNLGNASNLFRDVPEPWYSSAEAFTLALTRKGSDPPKSAKWPDGIYFNPRYLLHGSVQVGPLFQTEVAIHECAHFVQNDNIADIATHTLSDAYGYSGYVLHCAFSRDTSFDENQ
jgi:hypothetical protein